MAAWQVLGVISAVAFMAAGLNYNMRVDKLIEKHNGFSLGFATRFSSGRLFIIWPFFHYIDKTHPNYPQDMDRELEALGAHRLIMFVALIVFAAFILFGAALKVLS